MGFDFAAAFKRPVKVINDAAMQALGDYHGGRMLFLGLGTGLGSSMIVDGIVQPMELAHLPYKKRTYEDYVGLRGLEEFGKKDWRKHVEEVVEVGLVGQRYERRPGSGHLVGEARPGDEADVARWQERLGHARQRRLVQSRQARDGTRHPPRNQLDHRS